MESARCPLCGGGDMSIFFALPNAPVHCNVRCASRQEALAMPRGDIRLGFCETCGFIHNRAFDPARMTYSGAYENSLHFSPRFQQYAEQLATRLVETYNLHGKRILEIACGRGDFLRMLCRRGDNRGIGFDPSYVAAPGVSPSDDGVTIVADYYSDRHAAELADLVCCRHVLEHMADPVAFLRMASRGGVRQGKAVLFVEVPDALFTLRDRGIWDILYEHCAYFTPVSLAAAVEAADLRVMDLREAYDGQFLAVEATGRGTVLAEPPQHREDVEALARVVAGFGAAYRDQCQAWRERLEQLQRRGRRVAAWGSGTKGTMFLNALQDAGQVECIVDINPRKQGMYVPGAGQPIVAPQCLRTLRPDVVIVMNPIYAEEIGRMLAEMQLPVEVLRA